MPAFRVNLETLNQVVIVSGNTEQEINEVWQQFNKTYNQFSSDFVSPQRTDFEERARTIASTLYKAMNQTIHIHKVLLQLLETLNRAEGLAGNSNILGTPGY